MSEQFDILQVTIVEAKPGRAQISDTPLVTIHTVLNEPHIFHGVEIEGIYTAVVNDLSWDNSMLRAELRHALGLKPVVFNKTVILGVPILIAPPLEEADLPDLIGKVVRVVVTEVPLEGIPRLRVRHFLPPQSSNRQSQKYEQSEKGRAERERYLKTNRRETT